MHNYFNINYEFERERIHTAISEQLGREGADYICVADGVILDTANRHEDYLKVVNSGMFSICDSSFVPIYVRMIHGHRCSQYCGSEIFHDIVSSGLYRMAFLGANQKILNSLRENISEWNHDVRGMLFRELPFLEVGQFDYPAIADEINADGAEIVWVALGAPKQEYFMHRLKPYLKRGVLIAVGAAFKFYANTGERRAPGWMIRNHMEFVFRITQEPRKQLRRCRSILASLPRLLWRESKQKSKVSL